MKKAVRKEGESYSLHGAFTHLLLMKLSKSGKKVAVCLILISGITLSKKYLTSFVQFRKICWNRDIYIICANACWQHISAKIISILIVYEV